MFSQKIQPEEGKLGGLATFFVRATTDVGSMFRTTRDVALPIFLQARCEISRDL